MKIDPPGEKGFMKNTHIVYRAKLFTNVARIESNAPFPESGYVAYDNDAIDSFSFHVSLASYKNLSEPVDGDTGLNYVIVINSTNCRVTVLPEL
jgi:hypothetical protein